MDFAWKAPDPSAMMPSMRNSLKALVALGIFVLLNVGSLIAQSGSLYGASLEESAIAVRLVNLRSQGTASFRIGAIRLSSEAPGTATGYVPISADLYILRYEGQNQEFIPESGNFYSIVAGDGELIILRDDQHDDPYKSQIYAYVQPGFSSDNVSLSTADGAIAVLPSVGSGNSANVIVNPLQVRLQFTDAQGTPVGPEFDVSLQSGESTSIFLYRRDGDIQVTSSQAFMQNR